MSQLPLVSIVMVTYNQERLIEKAIASVIHQKGNFSIQLIIANDASTDGTLAVAKRWQQRYPDLIKIIDHPTNIGFRANYLSAVRAATGKYLCMCDADDYWIDKRKLDRQTAYMEAHPECALTFHRVVNLYEPSRRKTLSNGHQVTDTDITHLSRANYITNLSVMYRHELIDPATLPEWLAEAGVPDYAYHMLYASHGTIHYFSRPMGLYRQSSTGEWSLNTRRHRLEMALDVRLRLINHFGKSHPSYPGLREASANIIAALLEITNREEINAFLLPLTNDDIDSFLAARKSAAPTRLPLHIRVAKAAWAYITRLLPTPSPC